jgi:hypothetical protein
MSWRGLRPEHLLSRATCTLDSTWAHLSGLFLKREDLVNAFLDIFLRSKLVTAALTIRVPLPWLTIQLPG